MTTDMTTDVICVMTDDATDCDALADIVGEALAFIVSVASKVAASESWSYPLAW